MAVDLVRTGKAYFLSRPRRFGKSLFLDTLKELFEGNRALFTGLAADSLWDWGTRHPVIRISFSDGVLQSRAELDQRISEILMDNQKRLGVQCSHQSLGGQFAELIALTHQASGQRILAGQGMVVGWFSLETGVTEDMKAENPMRWAAQMNSLKHQAEEMILSELIYS